MTAGRHPTGDPDVADVPGASRYEILSDGELAGFADYRLGGGRMAFTHTEVAPPVGRRGLGTRLARAALDDARRRGLSVVPYCPFIAAFIRRNPAYADLVDPAHRDLLDP